LPPGNDEAAKTEFLTGAENGEEDVVRRFLEKGLNIETKDYRGETALHKAAKRGHEAVVRLLLEKGADINATAEH
jgi:ankyrin repeat protein